MLLHVRDAVSVDDQVRAADIMRPVLALDAASPVYEALRRCATPEVTSPPSPTVTSASGCSPSTTSRNASWPPPTDRGVAQAQTSGVMIQGSRVVTRSRIGRRVLRVDDPS